uniref:Uncharacterized protein n=1 Tax=Cacopsylla melanoneura TaxID=428564 RepID=A0A8D8Z9B8_9HEMI
MSLPGIEPGPPASPGKKKKHFETSTKAAKGVKISAFVWCMYNKTARYSSGRHFDLKFENFQVFPRLLYFLHSSIFSYFLPTLKETYLPIRIEIKTFQVQLFLYCFLSVSYFSLSLFLWN